MIGPADYFALSLLAFLAVATVLGSSPLRGLASLCLGLFLGLIGTDLLTGQQRFNFGIPQLADGIDVVIVAVGLFAVGEALHVASRLRHGPVEVMSGSGSFMTRADFARSWKPWLRGTALGFPFGAMPAGGAEIPTFLSYAAEKRLTKHKDEFGKGAIEGVAGPEAANNAAAAGVLVPLLTLGLPTSATAAILLAAFQQYGIQPGPTAADHGVGAGLDADRLAVHREHHAARAQPAAGRHLGETAQDSPAVPLRGDLALRLAGLVRGERRSPRPGDPAPVSGCSASRCAGSAGRWHRR